MTIALDRHPSIILQGGAHAGIRRWLWAVAALVFVMVVVGGATRIVAAQTFLFALFGQTGGRFGTLRLLGFERLDEA
ncbi:MAG: hypothetical protein Q8S58_06180, partial [Bosea sp. (in: a-proteobacteria)]|nr:hypothetical protein [Bosea sp. (in: a-proteobacteria)]